MEYLLNSQFKIYMPDRYGDEFSSKNSEPLKDRLKNGNWEPEEFSLLKEHVDPGDSVLELGACIGYIGVAVNSLIKNKNNHLVIEANPDLIPVIQKNKKLNGAEFSIKNCMVGNPETMSGEFGVSDFILGSSAYSKSLKKIKVDVVSLFDFINDFNSLMVDIEGGEYALIDEYIDHLHKFDKLMIEFHPFFGFNKEDLKRSVNKIKKCGFKQTARVAHVFTFKR
jgi:FkbM family methyltransferase